MKLNYKIAAFLGAPIYINISIILCFFYFWAKGSLWSGIISSVCFLLLMLAHEMGHAWFVKKYHHNLIKIHLYPIHGACEYEYDSLYEPETLIYAGGLIAQAAIFIIFFSFFKWLEFFGFQKAIYLLEPVGVIFIQANVFIFILNSLPIPGLDGHMLWKRFYEYVVGKLRKVSNLQSGSVKKKPPVSPEKIVSMAMQRAKRK
jgi:stage IV sporulation protein FB